MQMVYGAVYRAMTQFRGWFCRHFATLNHVSGQHFIFCCVNPPFYHRGEVEWRKNKRKMFVKIAEKKSLGGHTKRNWGNEVKLPLQNAATNGHVKCLEALLNEGADVNCADEEKSVTALIAAAKNGKDECVELLINNGADVNVADNNGDTALMHASFDPEGIKSVQLLLEAGADVNHGNEDGDTALMYAVGSRENDTITLLIKAGADVNAVNEMSSAAIYNFAISRGDWKCAETLAQAGADLNVVITARIRRMTGGYIFTLCVNPHLGGGVTRSQ